MVQYAAERPRPRKDEANASDIGQDGDSMIKLRRTESQYIRGDYTGKENDDDQSSANDNDYDENGGSS